MTGKYFNKILFFIVFLTFIINFSACKKEKTTVAEVARPVKLMTVKQAPSYNQYMFPGKVEADKKVTLAFKIPGTINDLPINIGQMVKEGQILAKLDDRNYKNRYDKAYAKLLVAKSEYERAEKLIKRHAVSESNYELKLTNYKIAKSDTAIAKKTYQDTTLKAPFSGIIAHNYADNYQEIKANEPILALQNISKLKVVVYVPDTFILGIDNYKEYKANATFSTVSGYTFSLTLDEFSTKADSETQAFKVVFLMSPKKDLYILPGMTAKVSILLKSRKNKNRKSYIVPASAIAVAPDGKPYVWIINMENSKVKQRFVKVGKLTSGNIIITDGVSPGEVIAISGVHYLRNGDRIREFDQKEYL